MDIGNHFNISNNYNQKYQPKGGIRYTNLAPLAHDTVSFSGKSPCELYKSVFDFMAAEILDKVKNPYKVTGDKLNVANIKSAIKSLHNNGVAYRPHEESLVKKIKWKSYIPEDVREFSINKINEARATRFGEWKAFLENPDGFLSARGIENSKLSKKIESDPSLRFVIWHSLTSEIKSNNRHIPVPFDDKSLLETIEGFERIHPKDRQIRCSSPGFLDTYTHRLRDNALGSIGKSGEEEVWVKVPSIAHDPKNQSKNIELLEILSCKNWCTRSSVDKAKAALEDGDFYIYLRRNKDELWEPLLGMTTSKGKIDQIQGVENNNIIPINLVEEVESFVSKNKLQCQSGIIDEGPKARQSILISKKLNETTAESKYPYTFARAIREKNDLLMYEFLGVPAKRGEDGFLTIANYKPSYNVDPQRGLPVPYSMFGIDENQLLQNVSIIEGNFILDAKQPIFNSGITQFPPNLKKVNGKVVCNAEQYKKFGADIERVVGEDKSKIIIHS